jgi:SAM-dependent methyltransferase
VLDETPDAQLASGGGSQKYGRQFYLDQVDVSVRASQVVVPVLREAIHPDSVVDVGCGSGSWLAAWIDAGVSDVTGIDFGAVPPEVLQVPASHVSRVDLSVPFSLDRRFDLAVSVEVAEHLPAERAPGFVADLTALAPVVAFSAAVPRQGGTGHVNERWQSYWADLFAAHGYLPSVELRGRIWDDERVAAYYAQNLVVYATAERAAELPLTFGEPSAVLDVIHPRLWERRVSHPLLWSLGRRMPEGLRNAITQRLRPRLSFLRRL